MMFDLSQAEAAYRAKKSQPEEKKKDKGLLSLLPSAAAAAASFIPGVGTIAGGLIGGAGEAGRQLLSGESFDLGKVGQEAALSAVPFGLGKAGKVVGAFKNATKGTRTSSALNATVPKEIDFLRKPGANSASSVEEVVKGNVLPESVPTTGQATPSLIDKFKTGAQNKSQEGMGLTVGQSAGRGKVLTPDKAATQYDFITNGAQKYGGIRAGKPIEQAKDAQAVHNNVITALDDSLNKINRPLDPTELTTIGQNVAQKIAGNAMITGKSSPTAQKLLTNLSEVTDLKSLEAIRRKADDVAFTQTGAGKTSAAAQAHSVRDAIDEFITPLSAEYKAVKGDYTLSRDALESLSKANKNAKGVKVPLVDIEVGKQGISGAVNKGAAIASGAQGSSLLDKVKLGARATGELAKQGATRYVAGPVLNPEQPAEEQAAEGLPTPLSMPQTETDSGGISQRQLMAAVAADPKNADTYITLYKLFNEGNGRKPLSAESAKTLSNAQAGLTSLDQLEGQLTDDPSIQQRGGISGTFNPFGLVSGALGTGEYENSRAQARDIIARIRTGAALTADEAKAFDKFLPQPGDSQDTVKQKLGTLRSQFQYIVDNAGGAGTDLQGAL